MGSQRPIVLVLVLAYSFSPTLLGWILNPYGSWYRPYFIWALVVVVAYLMAGRKNKHEL